MPFFLILVVALLFGLTPTAGAVVVRLDDNGTKLVVGPSGAVGANNRVTISSTNTPTPLIEVEELGEGLSGPPGCTQDDTKVSCPAAGVLVVDVDLVAGDDELTVTNLVHAADVRGVDVALGDGNDKLTTTGLVDPPGPLPRGAFVIARGDAGVDTLTGGAERDDFNGGAGSDKVDGGDGDDQVKGGPGPDAVIGGTGNDRLEVGVGPVFDDADGQDAVDGGPGDDTIGTGPSPGSIRPPQGPDTISGGDGNDTVDFSQRTQPLTISLDDVADDGEFGEGDNVRSDVEGAIGGSDGDTLTGSSAANFLDGRDSSDTLNGGAGDDIMSGGPGDDLLRGGTGEDNGRGGGGGDTLEGESGNDVLAGGTGADSVVGGDGDDSLDGGDLMLVGGDGPDELIGGPGDDRLFGGRGNDRLDGGLGADYLSGESEKDTVTYEDRTRKVVVTLDDLANDGVADEGDNVRPDVEVILGGGVNDDLSGDALANTVDGGAGEDLIDGKGNGKRNDPDRLRGGDEPDLVMARDGRADKVDCGDDGDLAIADDEDEVIGCQTVARPGSRAVVGRDALLSPLSPRRELRLRLPQGDRFYPLERFFPLVPKFTIRMGSTIDPKDGVVRLTTASDRRGGQTLVWASEGPFTVRQAGGRRPVTVLRPSGSLPNCPRASTQRGTAARAARSRTRKLRTRVRKGKRRVEVPGKYSTGASYGTDWITEDRCDGTLTTVLSGAVLVQDFGRGKAVFVRPGHPYLAKPF